MTTSSFPTKRAAAIASICLLALILVVHATPVLRATDAAVERAKIFWQNPTDIASRDLLYGIGGKKDAPPPGPFEWVKEDLNGTNPKFVVRDANGATWKIKLGSEAQPETVATRFVWAAGYVTDEDYFVPRAQITKAPSNTKRLQGLIAPDGGIQDARFERELKDLDLKKEGQWRWKDCDTLGARECNGLRALMALINNWDLKDENNSIYQSKNSHENIYVVSDLGASFGTTHRLRNRDKSKGDLDEYERSRFITHKTATTVSFATPGRPELKLIVSLPEYFRRVSLEKIGHNIPREDARWMGSVLARLSAKQIRDAFRAGGYSDDEVERFAQVVERRIAQLNAL